jgi:small conductance mechanosensitive channel
MIAILLAEPVRKPWNLPAWLTPDPERVGLILLRLALSLLAVWLLRQVLFLFITRGEKWLEKAARETPQGMQRAHTLSQILRQSVTTLLLGWLVVHVLEIFGWDVKPLLVGASIVGAALGFGAQYLVRDLIAGTYIFIENQYVVGELIEVNGVPATVELVTLRSTRLRDFNGSVIHVPNGELRIVVNRSRDWNRAIVDLPVAPGQDLGAMLRVTDRVIGEINADTAWHDLLVDPFVVLGIERAGPEGAVLRLVARARPGGDAARLAREARLRLLQSWSDAGIRTVAELGLRPGRPALDPGPAPSA